MVSFSCDKCQNVFTKPKVLRHLSSCRTETVSCIDCGVVFDKRSVRGHQSCISEAEKYAPKNHASTKSTPSYCGICKLALNGAVHSLQHYESKKHRAVERRMKETEKNAKKETRSVPTVASKDSEVAPPQNGILKPSAVERDSTSRTDGIRVQKRLGVKKAMKKVLKAAPKQRLKRDRLVRAVKTLLGQDSPADLPEVVDKKTNTSARFEVRKGRVTLVSPAKR